jgi:hypothetical protein
MNKRNKTAGVLIQTVADFLDSLGSSSLTP